MRNRHADHPAHHNRDSNCPYSGFCSRSARRRHAEESDSETNIRIKDHVGNDRKSTCDYLSGGEYCSDEYINGVFQNTVCGRTNPTAPGATRPAPAQAPSISSP